MNQSDTDMRDPAHGDPDDVGQRQRMESSAPEPPPGFMNHGWSRRGRRPNIAGYKSPVLAGLLSVVPGIGQIFVGHYQRGFTNIVVIAMTVAFLNWARPVPLDILGGFFVGFYWIYNIVDAIRLAHFYNAALAGDSPTDQAILPSRGGTVIGGVVLVVVAFVLVLHTNGVIPLDWLETWWPLIPLLFGIYLIYRGVQDRKATG